jgi:Beta-lactamase
MHPVPRPPEFAIAHLGENELIVAVRKRVDAEVAADRFAGAVLVAKDGRPVFEQAYGMADREDHVPNTLKTRFRIGSMNKMFTAVATLQLVAAGKLGLDDPLGKYLTDYPNKEAASKVTIRHLLTHMGGTGDFFGPEFDQHRLELRTHEDYVKLFGSRPLKFEPGSKWEYSNYGATTFTSRRGWVRRGQSLKMRRFRIAVLVIRSFDRAIGRGIRIFCRIAGRRQAVATRPWETCCALQMHCRSTSCWTRTTRRC